MYHDHFFESPLLLFFFFSASPMKTLVTANSNLTNKSVGRLSETENDISGKKMKEERGGSISLVKSDRKKIGNFAQNVTSHRSTILSVRPSKLICIYIQTFFINIRSYKLKVEIGC